MGLTEGVGVAVGWVGSPVLEQPAVNAASNIKIKQKYIILLYFMSVSA